MNIEIDINKLDKKNEAIPILLKRGCVSIHDSRLIHGSYPNTTINERRLGFVGNFMDISTKIGQWKYTNSMLTEWRTPRLMRGIPINDQYYFKKPIFNPLNEKQPQQQTPKNIKARQHYAINE